MKIRSPELLLREAGGVLRRFPFVLAAATIAGLMAVLMIGKPAPTTSLRIFLGAQLGIPLLLALSLYGERALRRAVLLIVAGAAALVLYSIAISVPPTHATIIRFVQLTVIAHLLVAFLPYWRRTKPMGFWQYNETLFLRLLNSLLFTAVLVIGLNVAMLALDKLFGLEIDGTTYARVDLILLFVFNTWYFLGGVPREFAELDRSRDFPRGLKIFAQYILAPLVAVYLALLTAYLVKVLITAEWPSGWIGWLVSSVAAAGLFSLALLHPLVAKERWITTYARVYFVLMLPAIGMLLTALAKRIDQYGFTEPRYFLLVLALWLLVVSVAGALNRLKRLEPLPATLCLVALVTSFGPWGAYSISRGSQMKRLAGFLRPAGLLVDGKLTRVDSAVDSETGREVSAILDYLLATHGYEVITPWLSPEQNDDLAAAADSLARRHQFRDLSGQVMGYMGQDYQSNWKRQARGEGWYSARREQESEGTPVTGFSHLYRIELPYRQPRHLTMAGRDRVIDIVGSDVTIGPDGGPPLTLHLDPLFTNLRGRIDSLGTQTVPAGLLTVEAEGESLRVRLVLNSIGWRERKEGRQIQQLDGDLLVGPR